MGDIRYVHKILVGNSEVRGPVVRRTRRGEDNVERIKRKLTEVMS
jgi:hypothetical protein